MEGSTAIGQQQREQNSKNNNNSSSNNNNCSNESKGKFLNEIIGLSHYFQVFIQHSIKLDMS